MTHDQACERVSRLVDEITIALLENIKRCTTDDKQGPYITANIEAYEAFCRAEHTRRHA